MAALIRRYPFYLPTTGLSRIYTILFQKTPVKRARRARARRNESDDDNEDDERDEDMEMDHKGVSSKWAVCLQEGVFA